MTRNRAIIREIKGRTLGGAAGQAYVEGRITKYPANYSFGAEWALRRASYNGRERGDPPNPMEQRLRSDAAVGATRR